ncbi:MAG: hypothetical protein M3010_11105 [Candidatus Dormibacteraeota bacterium]|nr:hypothetical protein [Candidatus Dormibacteraeota bacterium]
MRRWLVLLLTSILVTACGASAQQGGSIVVPPPAPPRSEPTPLSQASINVNHIHALASRDGGKRLLVATHRGVFSATRGAGSPQPMGGAGLTGDILSLAYAPGGALFAAGHNIGLKVSHDDGTTWAEASDDLRGADVHGLAVDPSHPGQMYAYAVGKGLLVSGDSGAHWAHRAGQADSRYITGLAVTADGTLLAGTPGLGVAASTDNGVTYVTVRDKTGPVYSIAASLTDANVVLVAAEGGIYLTGDGGKTWNVGEPNVAVTGVAIDPSDGHRFYAGGSDGTVAVSTDAGISFRPF